MLVRSDFCIKDIGLIVRFAAMFWAHQIEFNEIYIMSPEYRKKPHSNALYFDTLIKPHQILAI